MWKSIASAAIVGLIVLSVSQDAAAGWRRCRRYGTVWSAPAPRVAAAPAPAVPVIARSGTAQSGNGYSYRSFSYDPGQMVRAPAMQSQSSSAPSQSRFFRADRKMHGLSWYRQY